MFMIKTLPKNFRWVFFGDSITDANRLISLNPHKALGHGYALLASDLVNTLVPEVSCTPINRGISGNRLHDLILRLDSDVIHEKPNLVTILVGINDVLRAFDRNEPSPVEQFAHAYRAMLREIMGRTTSKIILMEPFLLQVNPEKLLPMVDTLREKQEVIGQIAEEFQLPFIRLQATFDNLCLHRGEIFWSGDGIHPTHSGHMGIALELIKVLMLPGFEAETTPKETFTEEVLTPQAHVKKKKKEG